MFPKPTIQSIVKSPKLNPVIYYSFIFLFFSVSLIPFNILEIKIATIPIHYVYIGGFAVLLAVLSFLQNPKLTIFDRWLFLLMTGLVLSLITSVDRTYSIRVLVGFITKGMFVAFITERIVKYNKKAIVSFLLLCASIVALFGLLELFFAWNPYAWNSYFKDIASSRIMYSTIGNPLVFGAYLVMFLPLTIWFLENTRGLFKIIPFFLTIFSILFSFSRIAWISMFCMFIIYFSKKECLMKIKKRWFIAVVFLIIVIIPFFIRPSFRAIFSSRFNINELKSMSYLERICAYKITWRIFKDYSLFGVGFGNYPNVYSKYKIESSWPDLITPDNMYLRFFCDTGIVGAGVFFTFITFWLYKIWKKRNNPFVWAIFCGLIGFLISQLVADLFLWPAPQFAFWTLLGMGVGLINEKIGKTHS